MNQIATFFYVHEHHFVRHCLILYKKPVFGYFDILLPLSSFVI